MVINLPSKVKYIIDKLKASGFEGYAVGGCVRDSLLGKTPEDWDICTNALPEQIKTVFKNERVIETGIKHGTVSVIIDHEPFEITTYRTEGVYSDNRRPDSVSFVGNLIEDLKRRDFTVNAMAYNEDEGLVDIYNGQDDLKNKVIRCVGNPNERFLEDALRIMRAIRFSAVLGFDIEQKTKEAIFTEKNRIKNIATERINVEFMKTIMSDNPIVLYEYKDVINVFLKNALSVDKKVCQVISELKKDKAIRLFVLMNSLYKDEKSIDNIKSALVGLKCDNKTIKRVLEIEDIYKKDLPENLIECRKMVSVHDLGVVLDYVDIKKTFASVEKDEDDIKKCNIVLGFLGQIQEKKLCTKIAELDINGAHLEAMGIKEGKLIGKILADLLLEVIEERVCNTNKSLIDYCKKYLKGNKEND